VAVKADVLPAVNGGIGGGGGGGLLGGVAAVLRSRPLPTVSLPAGLTDDLDALMGGGSGGDGFGGGDDVNARYATSRVAAAANAATTMSSARGAFDPRRRASIVSDSSELSDWAP
jgi:hypothetical protein